MASWRAANAGSSVVQLGMRCMSGAAVPKRVGVIGAGQMGTGIAIVAARHANLEVLTLDKFDQSLQRGAQFVKDWAGKEEKKGRMTEADTAGLVERVRFANLDDKAALSEVPKLDFVIEAVNEDLNIKKVVFQTLVDAGLRSDAVLASNTSSISITKMAAMVERPERFIGMHFMNPVPVMPLVEVIRGLRTDDATLATTLSLCAAMKKQTTTSEDRPGFIANRILMPYINEAVFALQDGIATAEDIDKTMKLGTGVPMGPLTLADFIGLDTCLSIMKVLHAEMGDSKYRPAPLLVNYVEAGWLGKKTKRGFYAY